jgi:hypothetical protein
MAAVRVFAERVDPQLCNPGILPPLGVANPCGGSKRGIVGTALVVFPRRGCAAVAPELDSSWQIWHGASG